MGKKKKNRRVSRQAKSFSLVVYIQVSLLYCPELNKNIFHFQYKFPEITIKTEIILKYLLIHLIAKDKPTYFVVHFLDYTRWPAESIFLFFFQTFSFKFSWPSKPNAIFGSFCLFLFTFRFIESLRYIDCFSIYL